MVLNKPTGSKEVRAEPFVAAIQGGDVGLVAGTWVKMFLDECEPWPFGRTKDMVDAAAQAYNQLTLEPVLDYTKAFA